MLTRMRRSTAAKDQGFTLIELLVVIIIIGILAAIAIPVFLNQRKKALDASLKSDLKNAAIVVETWVADHPGAPISWTVDFATTELPGVGILTGVTVSPGTGIAIMPQASIPGAYCLYAYNHEASTGWQFRTYFSNAGGLQSAAMTGPQVQAACA